MCNLAQVQYDELDAMFTQYVLNANAGGIFHDLLKFVIKFCLEHNICFLLLEAPNYFI